MKHIFLDRFPYFFLMIFMGVKRTRRKKLRKESNEVKKLRAMEQVTQMVAHDVRKPFSTLQAAMTLFENAESFHDIQEMLPFVQRSVDQALARVNGMLEDIMHFNDSSHLKKELMSPKQVVLQSLEEMGQIYQDAVVDIRYDWNHQSCTEINHIKVQRVFSNIFANAIQAMGEVGEIWVHTKERNGMIEFTLGNSGSSIDPETRERLFEAFYTKGKKNGTGLGLAIAKMIVEMHDGSIRVDSNVAQNTVEFVFTLPSGPKNDPKADVELPAHLADFLTLKAPCRRPRLIDDEPMQSTNTQCQLA